MRSTRRRLISFLAASAMVLTPLAVSGGAGERPSQAPARTVAASSPASGAVVTSHVDTTELIASGKHKKKKHKKKKHHKKKHHKKKHHKKKRPAQAVHTARPGSWAPLAAGVRWNPCRTIEYKVNLTGAPAGALADVHRAFSTIHAAGGLNFTYTGTTNKVPFTREDQFDTNTIIVAWTTPARLSRLSGSVIGIGGSSWSNNVYLYGGVSLDATARLPGGYGKGSTRGALLLHEIGHAIGLNHVNSKAEVMYPAIGKWSTGSFGNGDKAGLRALGSAPGCTA